MTYYNIIEDPYYDKRVANFYKILNLLYLWSAVLLFILYLIQSLNFSGGVVIWVAAMPFIFLVSMSYSTKNLEILIKN